MVVQVTAFVSIPKVEGTVTINVEQDTVEDLPRLKFLLAHAGANRAAEVACVTVKTVGEPTIV